MIQQFLYLALLVKPDQAALVNPSWLWELDQAIHVSLLWQQGACQQMVMTAPLDQATSVVLAGQSSVMAALQPEMRLLVPYLLVRADGAVSCSLQAGPRCLQPANMAQ